MHVLPTSTSLNKLVFSIKQLNPFYQQKYNFSSFFQIYSVLIKPHIISYLGNSLPSHAYIQIKKIHTFILCPTNPLLASVQRSSLFCSLQ